MLYHRKADVRSVVTPGFLDYSELRHHDHGLSWEDSNNSPKETHWQSLSTSPSRQPWQPQIYFLSLLQTFHINATIHSVVFVTGIFHWAWAWQGYSCLACIPTSLPPAWAVSSIAQFYSLRGVSCPSFSVAVSEMGFRALISLVPGSWWCRSQKMPDTGDCSDSMIISHSLVLFVFVCFCQTWNFFFLVVQPNQKVSGFPPLFLYKNIL